ncbi:MAG: hypothetical protein Q4E53_06070 [Eubacteriales bacterium]|nr:hypothetical protein [Eubacteriales bacterium]
MKKYYKKCLLIFLILLLLLFTPLNVSQFMLNSAQRDSLCEALSDTSWEDHEFKNSTIVASIDIFGVSGLGKHKTVYGYFNDGFYIEAHEKGYDISGSLNEFMVDIEVDGDNISIIKEYGDGVTSAATIEKMPWRYRCKRYIYVSMGLDQQLYARTKKKVKRKLGVPADMINTLSINEENSTYEIYDMNDNDEIIIQYSGKTSELYK